jgi:hypothetical protein
MDQATVPKEANARDPQEWQHSDYVQVKTERIIRVRCVIALRKRCLSVEKSLLSFVKN